LVTAKQIAIEIVQALPDNAIFGELKP